MKLIDLTGQTFGRLTVIKRATDKQYNRPYWVCKCSCGNSEETIVAGHNLTEGHVLSCGCLRSELTILHNKNMGDDIRCKKRKDNKYDLSGEYGIGFLENDEEFYFDLEDYDLISKYYWVIKYGNNGQYKRVVTSCKYDGKKYSNLPMHVILTGNRNIDHINRNPLDNRKCNYRESTYRQNAQNKSLQKNNTSGVAGVVYRKDNKKWEVRININKKQTKLGCYDNKEDAIVARLKAEKEYYGEFAPQQHLYEQYDIT